MSPDGSTVLFRALPGTHRLNLEDRRGLRQFVNELQRRLAPDRPVSCLITNDRVLQKLNREFLGHDYPTDVLSFPEAPGSASLGDLAVSIERAAEQAAAFGHSLMEELRILILHGVLHLMGMDHETDRGEMARAERKLRDEFALPVSLIARAGSRKPGIAVRA